MNLGGIVVKSRHGGRIYLGPWPPLCSLLNAHAIPTNTEVTQVSPQSILNLASYASMAKQEAT